MGITVTKDIGIENSWADSEQPKVFTEEMIVGKIVSWEEDLAQEPPFNKADFERDLQKVSRKVKK